MERYLYKAVCLDSGEWMKGNLAWTDRKERTILVPAGDGGNDRCGVKEAAAGGKEVLCFTGCRVVDPETVCRNTGEKDKDGRTIWENDILLHVDIVGGKEVPRAKGIVRFGECGFGLGFYIEWAEDSCNRPELLFWTRKRQTAVLGNVFDPGSGAAEGNKGVLYG